MASDFEELRQHMSHYIERKDEHHYQKSLLSTEKDLELERDVLTQLSKIVRDHGSANAYNLLNRNPFLSHRHPFAGWRFLNQGVKSDDDSFSIVDSPTCSTVDVCFKESFRVQTTSKLSNRHYLYAAVIGYRVLCKTPQNILVKLSVLSIDGLATESAKIKSQKSFCGQSNSEYANQIVVFFKATENECILFDLICRSEHSTTISFDQIGIFPLDEASHSLIEISDKPQMTSSAEKRGITVTCCLKSSVFWMENSDSMILEKELKNVLFIGDHFEDFQQSFKECDLEFYKDLARFHQKDQILFWNVFISEKLFSIVDHTYFVFFWFDQLYQLLLWSKWDHKRILDERSSESNFISFFEMFEGSKSSCVINLKEILHANQSERVVIPSWRMIHKNVCQVIESKSNIDSSELELLKQSVAKNAISEKTYHSDLESIKKNVKNTAKRIIRQLQHLCIEAIRYKETSNDMFLDRCQQICQVISFGCLDKSSYSSYDYSQVNAVCSLFKIPRMLYVHFTTLFIEPYTGKSLVEDWCEVCISLAMILLKQSPQYELISLLLCSLISTLYNVTSLIWTRDSLQNFPTFGLHLVYSVSNLNIQFFDIKACQFAFHFATSNVNNALKYSHMLLKHKHCAQALWMSYLRMIRYSATIQYNSNEISYSKGIHYSGAVQYELKELSMPQRIFRHMPALVQSCVLDQSVLQLIEVFSHTHSPELLDVLESIVKYCPSDNSSLHNFLVENASAFLICCLQSLHSSEKGLIKKILGLVGNVCGGESYIQTETLQQRILSQSSLNYSDTRPSSKLLQATQLNSSEIFSVGRFESSFKSGFYLSKSKISPLNQQDVCELASKIFELETKSKKQRYDAETTEKKFRLLLGQLDIERNDKANLRTQVENVRAEISSKPVSHDSYDNANIIDKSNMISPDNLEAYIQSIKVLSEPVSASEAKNIVEALYLFNDIFIRRSALKEAYCNLLSIIGAEMHVSRTSFIFELLQNADDCSFSPFVDPCFEITISPHLIESFHNEIGFLPKHVAALCSVAESHKKQGSDIGHKGIGFKSIFLVGDSVSIRSNNFRFKLDTNPDSIAQISPIWIPEDFSESHYPSDIGTTIKLKPKAEMLDAAFYSSISAQMMTSIESHLVLPLTLRNIRKICFRISDSSSNQPAVLESEAVQYNKYKWTNYLDFSCSDKLKEYLEDVKVASDVRLKSNINGIISWKVFKVFRFEVNFKKFSIDEGANLNFLDKEHIRTTSLTIAFPSYQENQELQNSFFLYAYLPAENAELPFLLNADFLLNSDRTRLLDRPWNEILLKLGFDLFGCAIFSDKDLMKNIQQFWPSIHLRSQSSVVQRAIQSFLDGDQAKTLRENSGSLLGLSNLRLVNQAILDIIPEKEWSLMGLTLKRIDSNDRKLFQSYHDLKIAYLDIKDIIQYLNSAYAKDFLNRMGSTYTSFIDKIFGLFMEEVNQTWSTVKGILTCPLFKVESLSKENSTGLQSLVDAKEDKFHECYFVCSDPKVAQLWLKINPNKKFITFQSENQQTWIRQFAHFPELEVSKESLGQWIVSSSEAFLQKNDSQSIRDGVTEILCLLFEMWRSREYENFFNDFFDVEGGYFGKLSIICMDSLIRRAQNCSTSTFLGATLIQKTHPDNRAALTSQCHPLLIETFFRRIGCSCPNDSFGEIDLDSIKDPLDFVWPEIERFYCTGLDIQQFSQVRITALVDGKTVYEPASQCYFGEQSDSLLARVKVSFEGFKSSIGKLMQVIGVNFQMDIEYAVQTLRALKRNQVTDAMAYKRALELVNHSISLISGNSDDSKSFFDDLCHEKLFLIGNQYFSLEDFHVISSSEKLELQEIGMDAMKSWCKAKGKFLVVEDEDIPSFVSYLNFIRHGLSNLEIVEIIDHWVHHTLEIFENCGLNKQYQLKHSGLLQYLKLLKIVELRLQNSNDITRVALSKLKLPDQFLVMHPVSDSTFFSWDYELPIFFTCNAESRCLLKEEVCKELPYLVKYLCQMKFLPSIFSQTPKLTWQTSTKKSFYSHHLSKAVSDLMSNCSSPWQQYDIIITDTFQGRIGGNYFGCPYLIIQNTSVIFQKKFIDLVFDLNSAKTLVIISGSMSSLSHRLELALCRLLQKHASKSEIDAQNISSGFTQQFELTIRDEVTSSSRNFDSMMKKEYSFPAKTIIQWNEELTYLDGEGFMKSRSSSSEPNLIKSQTFHTRLVSEVTIHSSSSSAPVNPTMTSEAAGETFWTGVLAEFFVHNYLEQNAPSYSPENCWVSSSRNICLGSYNFSTACDDRVGFNFKVQGTLFGISGKLFISVRGKNSLYNGRFSLTSKEYDMMKEIELESKRDGGGRSCHYIFLIVDNVQLLEMPEILWNSMISQHDIERGCHMFVRDTEQLVLTQKMCQHPAPSIYQVRDKMLTFFEEDKC